MTLSIETLVEHTALKPAAQADTGVVLRAHPEAQPRRHRAAQTYVLAVALDNDMGANAFRQTTAAVCAALREVSDEDDVKLCVFGAQPYTLTLTAEERQNPDDLQRIVKQLQRRGVADFDAMLKHIANQLPHLGESTLVVFAGADAIDTALTEPELLTSVIGENARAHLVAVGPLGPRPRAGTHTARVETWHLDENTPAESLMTTLCGKRRIRVAKSAAWHIRPCDGVELDASRFGHHARFTRDAIVVPVGPVWAGLALETALQLHVQTGREPGPRRLLDISLVSHDDAEHTTLAQSVVSTVVRDGLPSTHPAAVGALWFARSEQGRVEAAHLRERGHGRAAARVLGALLDEFRELPLAALDARLHTQYAFLLGDTVTPKRTRTGEYEVAHFASEPPQQRKPSEFNLRRSVAAEPLAGAHVTFEGDTIVGIYELAACNRIGRSRENDIVIQSGHISRHHADIVREAGNFIICDHGSANGTFINGRRVAQRAELKDGDVVVFSRHGETRMTFHAGIAGQRRRTTREFPAVNIALQPVLGLTDAQPRVNLAPKA